MIHLLDNNIILTMSSLRSLSSSWAEGGTGCALPLLNSSSCRVSSSTLATATDNSFSFSLNSARIDSRSLAVNKANYFDQVHSLSKKDESQVTQSKVALRSLRKFLIEIQQYIISDSCNLLQGNNKQKLIFLNYRLLQLYRLGETFFPDLRRINQNLCHQDGSRHLFALCLFANSFRKPTY